MASTSFTSIFLGQRRFASLCATTIAMTLGLQGCFVVTDDGRMDDSPGRTNARPAQKSGAAKSSTSSAQSKSASSSASAESKAKGSTTADPVAVNRFLDAWHNAAAIADEDTYFGSMTPNGIFVGTDKKEIWTRQEFMDTFKEKHFVGKEEAWTYYPKSRNLHFSPNGQVAWFDEKLWSKQEFHMRGSGTLLRQTDGSWKIAHYVMSFPVPNEVAKEVLGTIRDFEETKGSTGGEKSSTSTQDQSSSAQESSSSDTTATSSAKGTASATVSL